MIVYRTYVQCNDTVEKVQGGCDPTVFHFYNSYTTLRYNKMEKSSFSPSRAFGTQIMLHHYHPLLDFVLLSLQCHGDETTTQKRHYKSPRYIHRDAPGAIKLIHMNSVIAPFICIYQDNNI